MGILPPRLDDDLPPTEETEADKPGDGQKTAASQTATCSNEIGGMFSSLSFTFGCH